MLHQIVDLVIAFDDRVAKLVAVQVDVVEKPLKIAFASGAFCRCFDIFEYLLQSLIEVLAVVFVSCLFADVGKQLRGQNEVALFLDDTGASPLSILVRKGSVIRVLISSGAFAVIDVLGELLRDKAVEHHAEHIRLKIPTIHAATQVVGDVPNSPVQLCPVCVTHSENPRSISKNA